MIHIQWSLWKKYGGCPVLQPYSQVVNHGDLFTVPKHSKGRLHVIADGKCVQVDAKEGDVLRVYELGVIKENEDRRLEG